jgi:hypothetical protein
MAVGGGVVVIAVGFPVGALLLNTDGMAVGGGVVVVAVGFPVGFAVGFPVGFEVGCTVGFTVVGLLTTIGCCVGNDDRVLDGSLDSLLFAPSSEGTGDGPSEEDTREGRQSERLELMMG